MGGMRHSGDKLMIEYMGFSNRMRTRQRKRVKDDTEGFIFNHLMIMSGTNIKEKVDECNVLRIKGPKYMEYQAA